MRRLAILMGAVLAIVSCFGVWNGVVDAQPGAAGDSKLKQLAQARLAAAKEVLAALDVRIQAGEALTPTFLDVQATWYKRECEAALDAAADRAGRIAAVQAYHERADKLLMTLKSRVGQDITRVQLLQGEYLLADAKYWLAKVTAE
jgi:hypothetical protein